MPNSKLEDNKSKACYPPEEYLKKENYKVINNANHVEGHKTGILDDPTTTWEEKSKKMIKLKEEKSST